jgi:hypothetical protein
MTIGGLAASYCPTRTVNRSMEDEDDQDKGPDKNDCESERPHRDGAGERKPSEDARAGCQSAADDSSSLRTEKLAPSTPRPETSVDSTLSP